MSNRKYRLNDNVATELGLTLNKNKRYRLDQFQEERLTALRPSKPIKRLFFDIETSPNIVYSWRIGYKINLDPSTILHERKIICLSYKWEGEDKVHSLIWDDTQSDKQLLIDFLKVADTADEIVGHNSNKFDIKWLRARAIYHRVPMFPTYRSLDTLQKSRGGFNFNSHKLDYIGQYLGVGQKVKHSGFQMWKDVMNGDHVALQEMVTYCEGDIILLEDVFQVMRNYITMNTHTGVTTGKERFSCPSCGSEHVVLLKNEVTPKGIIQRRMQCEECGHTFVVSNKVYMDYLKRK